MRGITAPGRRLDLRFIAPFLTLAVAGCIDQPVGNREGTGSARTGVGVIAHTPDTGWHMLHIVVVGRVVEIEPDAIEVAFINIPDASKTPYKVAIVRIEDRVYGASGLTLVRVGFPVNQPYMALKPDMVGCLALAIQPDAGFYTQIKRMTEKSNPGFVGEVQRLRKMGRVLDAPIAALKAKELDDRFDAAVILLERYTTPHQSNRKELVPGEENRLILALLAELPWLPDGGRQREDGGSVPHRRTLWYMIDMIEWRELGFRETLPTTEMLLDEQSLAFLKENGGKIRLKRYVQK